MSNLEKQRFSILVPVYNAEKFLHECIESVLSQTYRNFEIVLIDDGSTDNSGTICDQYAEKYDYILAYHTDNGGQVRARELAMQYARGDFYVFLDADDKLRTNALETIATAIDKYQCDCAIYGFVKTINGEIVQTVEEDREEVLTDKREIYRRCLNDFSYNAIWRKAVKASVYKNTNTDAAVYQVRLGEDLLQSLTVLKNSEKIAFIKGALYEYRDNPDSISYTYNYDAYAKSMNVDTMVLRFLRNECVFTKEDYDEYRHTCLERYVANLLRIYRMQGTLLQKTALMRKMSKTDCFCDFLKYEKNSLPFKRKILFLLNRWGLNVGVILVASVYAKWLEKEKNCKQ